MANANAEDVLLTKAEIAAYLRVSIRTVEMWVRKGYIPALRIGRSVRFDRKAILQYLSEH